jgi:hypothetical protein
MHRTDDPDLWITNPVDPWILAAAYAGDIRAMRFAARRARYRPSDVYERLLERVTSPLEELTRFRNGERSREEEFGLPGHGDVLNSAYEADGRERDFWYTKAAEYGDAESIAELLKKIGPEHQRQHLYHLLSIAKYSAGSENGLRVPGRVDLFLATYPIAVAEAGPLRDLQERWEIRLLEAGARDGCESCMKRLAEQEPAEDPPRESRSWNELQKLDELGNRAVNALISSDAEWVATVIDLIPPYGHRMRHLLRVLAEARYQPDSPEAGAQRGLPGWWGIELCEAGAGTAFDYEPCVERWAGYQRNHGPGYQADLHRWQERAEQELAKRLPPPPPPPPPRFGAGPSAAETIVTTAVIASVLVPFVQTMITKAAEDSYKGLRRHLKACFGKAMASHETPDRDDQLVVIRPPEGQQPSAVLQIWTDLPDEAISALSQLLYDLRTTQPPPHGAECRWYWNGTARRWEALQLPGAGHNPPDTDDQPDQG